MTVNIKIISTTLTLDDYLHFCFTIFVQASINLTKETFSLNVHSLDTEKINKSLFFGQILSANRCCLSLNLNFAVQFLYIFLLSTVDICLRITHKPFSFSYRTKFSSNFEWFYFNFSYNKLDFFFEPSKVEVKQVKLFSL